MPDVRNSILLSRYCHVRNSADIILRLQQNQGLVCSALEGLPREILLQNTLKYLLSYSKQATYKILILSLILVSGPKAQGFVTKILRSE
jgi:hypothetical protein